MDPVSYQKIITYVGLTLAKDTPIKSTKYTTVKDIKTVKDSLPAEPVKDIEENEEDDGENKDEEKDVAEIDDGTLLEEGNSYSLFTSYSNLSLLPLEMYMDHKFTDVHTLFELRTRTF